jgi:exopolysaccharide production protein ExoQ
LAIPLLAMMSTAWSDAPERTVRAAIQMLLTMVAAIIVCRRISAETLIVMLFVCMIGMCVLAVPSLPYVFQTQTPLLGPYASKNAMAYAAHLLVALSLAVTFERKRSVWWRLAAVAAIAPALFLLKLSQSSGAFLALIMTLLTFPALLLVGRVNGIWRFVMLALALVGVGVAVALLPDIEAAATDVRQNVLQKDATLTGRTYLWDFAYRLAAERPVLGHGYYAFWRVGNIDAEGLWRYAGIASRSGFNFHNAFIEMRVDMGWVGTILLVVTCAAILGLALFRQFTKPSTAMAFLTAVTIGELVRSTAETSLFGPFSYYTLLLMATAIYSAAPSGQRATTLGLQRLMRASQPAKRTQPTRRALPSE